MGLILPIQTTVGASKSVRQSAGNQRNQREKGRGIAIGNVKDLCIGIVIL